MRERVRADACLGRAEASLWTDAAPLLQKALGDEPVEQLIEACLDDTACFLASNEAFAVVTQCQDEGEDVLIVWAAASRLVGDGMQRSVFEESIDEIARALGAKRIIFRAPRRGYSRILGSQWKLKYVCWEKELVS